MLVSNPGNLQLFDISLAGDSNNCASSSLLPGQNYTCTITRCVHVIRSSAEKRVHASQCIRLSMQLCNNNTLIMCCADVLAAGNWVRTIWRLAASQWV